ncbi:IS1595 family transposase [Flavobacterium sp. TR2]|uniref:IS1595 family transposase n=1 Tax=Flavobacterium sp. TR2 TaxID=2977321 RepID=UPI0021B14969|nr:IS1595 family transposase [Flavobacterium sp. TR2]UWY26919.1 IS1595 family transposase [Flavobacterium sp. TR2]
MTSIKYDFKSCYDAYDFSHVDYEEINTDLEPTSFQEACEDILRDLLIKWGLEEAPKPKPVVLSDAMKLLITRSKKARKTLPITPKSIIFNKTNMSKHIDIELDTVQIFKSVYDMGKVLNTEMACREHLEKLRWNGEPICPHCGSQRENHYKIKGRTEEKFRYKCKDCRLPFTVTVGTIFEKSTVPLQKWFRAIFKFTTNKKGMSSYELMREIGVTQKTAWFMLSRIRNSVRCREDFEFDGITQVDETFVGGKNKNRSKGKKVDNTQGRSTKTKTPVFGMLNNGIVYTEVVENTEGDTLKSIINAKVKKGSTIVSDGWRGYTGLYKHYSHKVIQHNLGYFKKGSYHTNGIEGFWGQLKRGIIGVYHKTSDKHLHRYCDEFAYRYNIRTMSVGEQFNLTLINCDERLSYKRLIAKV